MTPTFESDPGFLEQWRRLTPQQRDRFMVKIMTQFVPALSERRALPPRLRVKRVQGTVEVYELTWAPDGRATFTYGEEVVSGEPHIRWRRIGTHAILTNP